jgi:hypothetical protein
MFFPALFLGMLGGVLDDTEALESLDQTVNRMYDIHQRLHTAHFLTASN